jgi:hypothetical protein
MHTTNDLCPSGFTVVNADGAWLADKGGAVGWTTDPSDWDILLFRSRDEATANAEPAQGERAEWKGVRNRDEPGSRDPRERDPREREPELAPAAPTWFVRIIPRPQIITV